MTPTTLSVHLRQPGRPRALLAAGLGLGGLLLLLAIVGSVAFGAADIAPANVWQAVVEFAPASTSHLIIRTLRLPRALVAALVGAALAVAGALMQGLTRNPLADAGVLVNIGVGEYPVPPLDVLRTVLGLPTDEQDYSFIVNTLRMPRMLVAALVGMALGVSGAIIQGLTRNPLADPGILGISSGAGLVAVILIIVVRGVAVALVPVAAFGGALLVAGLIYLLAWRGGDSPIRLILVGIGIGAVTSALTSLLITFGDIYDVQRALIWLSGSVYGRSWDDLWPLLPWVALGVPLALLQARELNALALGDEVARGLGSRVALRRGLLLLTAVALAASTVSAAGTIGFVGLMAPHMGRRLVGPDHTGLLPAAGILGALLVVTADLAGRTLFAPLELPCGLVVSAVGAPFFLALLWHQRRG